MTKKLIKRKTCKQRKELSLKSNHKIPAFPFTNVISFIPNEIQDLSQIKFFMKIYMSTVYTVPLTYLWAKNKRMSVS